MTKADWLASDVSIVDLTGRTADLAAYLKGIYLNMVPDQAAHPTLRVRITRVGSGHQPDYRIERDDVDGETIVMGFFQGDTHKPLAKRYQDIDGEIWSKRTMSYVDVRELHNSGIRA